MGSRTIYTSGIVFNSDVEEIQDNKLAVGVCGKLDIKLTDRYWFIICLHPAFHVPLQIPSDKTRISCCDYREIPTGINYNKIVSLEMSEVSQYLCQFAAPEMIKFHKYAGVRHYSQFLSEVYDLLDDDGIFVLRVAGIHPSWKYEELIWLVLFVVCDRYKLLTVF